jgi:hypothetical protein
MASKFNDLRDDRAYPTNAPTRCTTLRGVSSGRRTAAWSAPDGLAIGDGVGSILRRPPPHGHPAKKSTPREALSVLSAQAVLQDFGGTRQGGALAGSLLTLDARGCAAFALGVQACWALLGAGTAVSQASQGLPDRGLAAAICA